MTEDAIIDGVLQREGGYVDHPEDRGGPTKFGITAVTLGVWRDLGRAATRAEVLHLGEDEARTIYRRKYVIAPGFLPVNLPHDGLRAQMVDFGVNSGPARAIRWLQRVLRVPATGVLDTATVTWLYEHMAVLDLVNDALVAARLLMLDRAIDAGVVSKDFEEGLESRALAFVLTRA